jgi:hypothetical protein
MRERGSGLAKAQYAAHLEESGFIRHRSPVERKKMQRVEFNYQAAPRIRAQLWPVA